MRAFTPSVGFAFGFALMLGGTFSAEAQTALRAPLSIVPPPMQAALGRTDRENGGAAKLAPRVAARQMKRAVRAVAATPGTQGDVVQVGQLGALEDAPVGLEDGLGDALWNGARLAFVVDQMARLPANMAMASLHGLERRLHRGATAAPIGTVDDTSWFAARMMRLLALGDTQSAIDLEAKTGAALNDAYAARALVLAHLGRGDRAAACGITRPTRGSLGRRNTVAFFTQMLVYCQLLSGEYEKAGLTLELNEKTLGKDALFRDMAYLMAARAPLNLGMREQVEAAEAANETPPLVLPDELTPLQIALLQLAGKALPTGLMNLPNYFMGAVAVDYAQSPLVQLRAAHLAVRYGASAEIFSQAAQLADLTAYETQAPGDEDVPAAVFLALALRAIDAAPPQAQPRLMADYLHQSAARSLWHDMVYVLDDRLAALLVPQADTDDDSYNDNETPLAAYRRVQSGLDNPELSALTPPAAAPSDEPAAPLAEEDRLILLLAHWQKGNRAAAENLMNLSPLPQEVALLGRWQGYVRDEAAVLDMPIANETPLNQFANYENKADGLPALAIDEPALEGADEVLPGTQNLPDLADELVPDWTDFESRLSQADAVEGLYLRRQLAIYHALGVALPDNLLVDLVLPQENALIERFTRLADNKWVGDLVLAQIAVLADKPVASYDATDTLLLIGPLRRAGLQAQAEAMAADMLLAHKAAFLGAKSKAAAASLRDESGPVPFRSQLFEEMPNGG